MNQPGKETPPPDYNRYQLTDAAAILRFTREVLGFVIPEEELERGIPPSFVDDLTQTSIIDIEQTLTSLRNSMTKDETARTLAAEEFSESTNAKIRSQSSGHFMLLDEDLNYGLGNSNHNVPNIVDIPEFFRAFKESQSQGHEIRDMAEQHEALENEEGGSPSRQSPILTRKRPCQTYEPNQPLLVELARKENTELEPVISGVQSLPPTPPPLLRDTNYGNFLCGLCRKHLESKMDLHQHLVEVHPTIARKVLFDPFFRCGSCLKAFGTSVAVTIHANECTRSRPDRDTVVQLSRKLLTCGFCKKSHTEVGKTQECYHQNGQIRCILCLLTVDSKQNWTAHMEYFHKQDEIENPAKYLRCIFCYDPPLMPTRNCIEHMVDKHLSKPMPTLHHEHVTIHKSKVSEISAASLVSTVQSPTSAMTRWPGTPIPLPRLMHARAPTTMRVTTNTVNKKRVCVPRMACSTPFQTPSTTHLNPSKVPMHHRVEVRTSSSIMHTMAPRPIPIFAMAQRNPVGFGTTPRVPAPVTGATPRALTPVMGRIQRARRGIPRAPASGGTPRHYDSRKPSPSPMSVMVESRTGPQPPVNGVFIPNITNVKEPSSASLGSQQSPTRASLLPKCRVLVPTSYTSAPTATVRTGTPLTVWQTGNTRVTEKSATATLFPSPQNHVSSGNLQNSAPRNNFKKLSKFGQNWPSNGSHSNVTNSNATITDNSTLYQAEACDEESSSEDEVEVCDDEDEDEDSIFGF